MNRADFAVVFSVRCANPNGDPLDENRPRMWNNSLGWVSQYCIKRKIRNCLANLGYPIYIQTDDDITDGCKGTDERLAKLIKEVGGNKDQEAIKQAACAKWIDVRLFGQVFATSNFTSHVTGPVTIGEAFSVEPVDIVAIKMTKSASKDASAERKSGDTFGGMKYVVDKGTYVAYGNINGRLAEKTGCSEEDVAVLRSVLPKLFADDVSTARPAGSMWVDNVVWWQHTSIDGHGGSPVRICNTLQVNPTDGTVACRDLAGGPVPEVILGF